MKKLLLIIVFFGLIPVFGFTQTRAEIEDMMDSFCSTFFEDCYSGRTYKNIYVSDFSVDQENQQINVQGNVTYLNLFELRDTQDFRCTITVRSSGKVIYYFKKKSLALDGSTFWEDCERGSDDISN